jgi:4-diphosphocytidyl-2-C-methyl-D-erythritol kinase
MKLVLEAFAKLNLSLRVLRRRDDGFHEIDSVVQTIDLSDEIAVERVGTRILVANDASVDAPDIAERATYAMLAAKGSTNGFRISIRKRTSIGAGLGGGSSDAAAVLHAVDAMTPPPSDPEVLRRIAASVGSDVPLFLTGGRLRITGRGERIERLPMPEDEHFVIVVPPIHCATAAVYGAWQGEGRTPGSPVLGENDLLAPALHVYPELGRYRDAVAALDAAYWGMSGSGSCFYAAYVESAQADRAAASVERSVPEADVFVCRSTDVGFRVVEEEL